MALLRSPARPETDLYVRGRGIYLRTPQLADFDGWARLRTESREYLVPWEPTWPPDDLTRMAYRRRLRRYARDIREDLAYPFFIFRTEDNALVGGCTLSNVQRGVTQSCSVGYWIGERHAGAGLMTRALSAVTGFVFDSLELHRLEAACLPSNAASRAVLRKCGFTQEGLARRYLKINGVWRDHLLFAILCDDPRP